MTSWAILALIYGRFPDKEVIKRGVGLIISRQQPDGRWNQEDTEGIFNKNCAIDYAGASHSRTDYRETDLFGQCSSSSSPYGLWDEQTSI